MGTCPDFNEVSSKLSEASPLSETNAFVANCDGYSFKNDNDTLKTCPTGLGMLVCYLDNGG
jgi:hypothetical protein